MKPKETTFYKIKIMFYRHLLPYLVLVLALMVLLCCGTLFGIGDKIYVNIQARDEATARANDLNFETNSPIALDKKVSYCQLSPDGRFMLVVLDSNEIVSTYDMLSKEYVDLPVNRSSQNEFWLENNLILALYKYSAERREPDSTQGKSWLMDPATKVITDVNTLTSTEQLSLIAKAKANHPNYLNVMAENGVSPNGKYNFQVLNEHAVIYDNNHLKINEYNETRGIGVPCFNGWKPDSSGYYYIDSRYQGLFTVSKSYDVNNNPGPIRLMLTHDSK